MGYRGLPFGYRNRLAERPWKGNLSLLIFDFRFSIFDLGRGRQAYDFFAVVARGWHAAVYQRSISVRNVRSKICRFGVSAILNNGRR